MFNNLHIYQQSQPSFETKTRIKIQVSWSLVGSINKDGTCQWMSGCHGRDPACQSSQGLLVSKTQKCLIKEGGNVSASHELLLRVSGVITLQVIQRRTYLANSGFILFS